VVRYQTALRPEAARVYMGKDVVVSVRAEDLAEPELLVSR
jgi:hypothetical protein